MNFDKLIVGFMRNALRKSWLENIRLSAIQSITNIMGNIESNIQNIQYN